MNIRIIGDPKNGIEPRFLDLELDIEALDGTPQKKFWLVSYPDKETVQKIREKVCGDLVCECNNHEFYRMRDIYNDGNIRLEVRVERF